MDNRQKAVARGMVWGGDLPLSRNILHFDSKTMQIRARQLGDFSPCLEMRSSASNAPFQPSKFPSPISMVAHKDMNQATNK